MSSTVSTARSALESRVIQNSLALRLGFALVVIPVLTAAGAATRIYLPGIPVPFTLQTLFVILSGAYLGEMFGPVSMLAYLLYGVLGLNMFAIGDGTGSLNYLLGISGGYLLAFPLASLLVARLLRLGFDASFGRRFVALFSGTLLILASGLLFALLLHGQNLTLGDAFLRMFVVFVPFGAVKALLAASCLSAARKRRAMTR